jgi:hypothetical protein
MALYHGTVSSAAGFILYTGSMVTKGKVHLGMTCFACRTTGCSVCCLGWCTTAGFYASASSVAVRDGNRDALGAAVQEL